MVAERFTVRAANTPSCLACALCALHCSSHCLRYSFRCSSHCPARPAEGWEGGGKNAAADEPPIGAVPGLMFTTVPACSTTPAMHRPLSAAAWPRAPLAESRDRRRSGDVAACGKKGEPVVTSSSTIWDGGDVVVAMAGGGAPAAAAYSGGETPFGEPGGETPSGCAPVDGDSAAAARAA